MHVLQRLGLAPVWAGGTTVLVAVGTIATVDSASVSGPVAIGVIVVATGALVMALSLVVRIAVRDEVGGLQAQSEASDEGALLLDYVKPTSLVALAEELNVDTPEHLERLESSSSGVSAKAGAAGAELGVSQQEKAQVTRLYERSLNGLAGRLLTALEKGEGLAVRRDLALLPPSKDREVLAHLEALHGLGIDLGDDAPTAEEIRSRFEKEIAETKRQDYRRVASADRVPLVLVEGRWLVVDSTNSMTLQLAELAAGDGTDPQPMPAGVGLHANFEKSLRTDMGNGRLILSDVPTPAAILGAPAGMTGNILYVNPVIIFTRYGGRSGGRYRGRLVPDPLGTR